MAEKFINESTLHFEDDTFKKLRADADQVLQKLLANMAEKGSLEGKLTISVDVSFTEETVQNRDPNIPGETRVVHTPKFQHKVGSVLQIKNEQKGDMNCDGMEMVWDDEKGEYILRPITGREQMSVFDYEMEQRQAEEEAETEYLEGQKVAALPGPADDIEDAEYEEVSAGQSEDSPQDNSSDDEDDEDLSDEFDYTDPEEF